MKHFPNFLTFAIACGFTFTAAAQNYQIDRFVIAGGGGSATGGVYAVTGTIGQLDATAALLEGGPYSLAGGFWQLLALQTPGSPQLTILLSPTNTVLLMWPATSSDFALEEKSDLNAAGWTPVPAPPTDVGGNRVVVVNMAPGNRFYRLVKP